MTTPSDADAKAAEGFPSIACNLRGLIRQAMPGIDGKCHVAGEQCECVLCLADKLGRLYATERAARERAEGELKAAELTTCENLATPKAKTKLLVILESSPPLQWLPKIERRPEFVRVMWLWFAISVWKKTLAEYLMRLADESN